MRAGTTRLYLRGRIWWCWGYDSEGRRWLESTHQTERRAAEQAAIRITIRRAAAVHQPAAAPAIRLSHAWVAMQAALVRGGRASDTIAFYTRKIGHVSRLLGDVELATLTRSDLERYADARIAEDASRSTIAKELQSLRTAAKCIDIAVPGLPVELRGAYVPRKRWLPVPEYRRLLAALPAPRRDYLVAFCGLGVRDSELYAITREDVLKADVHVRGTKTRRANRHIPLAGAAAEVLRRRAKAARPRSPLFPVWKNIRRDLRAACTRATVAGEARKLPTVEPVSPNDLRRTFTSWCCNAGVDALVCARLLGHAGTRMVAEVYGQLSTSTLRAGMRKVQAFQGRPAVAGGVAQRGRSGAQHADPAQHRTAKRP